MYNSVKQYILVMVILGSLLLPNLSMAANFTLNVSDEYASVEAGTRLYFEVDVNDLDVVNEDLRLYYEILKDNNILLSGQSTKAIENNRTLVDYVVIPDNYQGGDYVINVRIESASGSITEIQNKFRVVGTDVDKLKEYFLILVRVVIGVAILVAINVVSTMRKPEERWT